MKNLPAKIKFSAIIIPLLVTLFIIFFSNFAYASEDTNSYVLDEWLSKQDGVEIVEHYSSNIFTEKIMITVEQPLDWETDTGITFKQRVLICFRDYNALNECSTEGYEIYSPYLNKDKEDELSEMYKMNLIAIEHRFFDKSAPDGLDNKKADMWQYLTCENAAADYHRIHDLLSQIFTNKWIAAGYSKGGETALMYTYFYPDDIDFTVPYVAPWNVSDDTRAYDFVFTEAGDEQYGREKAKNYRDLLTNMVIDCIVHRDIVEKLYDERIAKDQLFFWDDAYGRDTTQHCLYEVSLLEFELTAWQYDQDWETYENVYNLSWDTQSYQKATQYLDLIWMWDDVEEENEQKFGIMDDLLFPYYIQGYHQIGDYRYNFDYIREKLPAGVSLYTSKDMEDTIYYRTMLSPQQREVLHYDMSLHNDLIEWFENTDKNIMFIYGSSDPWYSMRIKDIDGRDNIKRYVSKTKPHSANIANLEVSDNEDAKATLNKWINEEKTETTNVDAYTFDSTSNLIAYILLIFCLAAIVAFCYTKKNNFF